MIHPTFRAAAAALLLATLFASSAAAQYSVPASPAANSLTPGQRSAGWRLLFDGKTMDQWRGYQKPEVPSGWTVKDGTIVKQSGTGDIITREQFGNFELELDWKLGTGGNAGIFYRGTEEYEHIYWSGPEYQLLDDANAPDGKNRLTSAGAAYGLYPSPAGIVKPANQWNTARIVVKDKHVEHWLNGQKLLEYELQSPDWEAKVQASKFSEWPNYGRAAKGYIAIQGDHDGELSLRNIRVRELK